MNLISQSVWLLVVTFLVIISAIVRLNVRHQVRLSDLNNFLKETNNITISDTQKEKDPSIIFLVLSSRENSYQRTSILKTWAKNFKNQVFFFIGKHCPVPEKFQQKYICDTDLEKAFKLYGPTIKSPYPNAYQNNTWNNYQELRTQRIVSNEQNVILLEDVIDSYRTLPRKFKLALKWALKEFPGAQFFAKIDDDMYVRPQVMEQMLMNFYSKFDDQNSSVRAKYAEKFETAESIRNNPVYDFNPEKYQKMDLKIDQNPLILGHFERRHVSKKPGPNMETDYKHRTYPIFPLGSFGYVVNRKWAEYVASDEKIDNLYEYQGEDTSTGIWMDEAPIEIREEIRYVFTWYFQNNRNCTDPNRAIGWRFWFFLIMGLVYYVFFSG